MPDQPSLPCGSFQSLSFCASQDLSSAFPSHSVYKPRTLLPQLSPNYLSLQPLALVSSIIGATLAPLLSYPRPSYDHLAIPTPQEPLPPSLSAFLSFSIDRQISMDWCPNGSDQQGRESAGLRTRSTSRATSDQRRSRRKHGAERAVARDDPSVVVGLTMVKGRRRSLCETLSIPAARAALVAFPAGPLPIFSRSAQFFQWRLVSLVQSAAGSESREGEDEVCGWWARDGMRAELRTFRVGLGKVELLAR